MTLKPVNPSTAHWDTFVTTHPRAHLLQLSAWGELKAAFGWRPVRVALTDAEGALVAGVQLLFRRLPFRLGWLAYAPYGPLVDWSDSDQVQALLAAIDHTAQQHSAAFLKIEPGYGLDAVDLAAFGFRRSSQTVQPPRTIMLDITGDDDAILKQMNQGTRRNIRKSIKNDIVIREGTRDDVMRFNALLAETGERAAFGVHTPDYYTRVYELFMTTGHAALMMGSYAGQDLAGVMVFALGDQSWYFYGASSERERKRMASYGVQWAGIQWAKTHGVITYDMVGIPDADQATLEAQFQTRADGLWGVYRFKRGWGGTIMRSVGAWDRAYNQFWYTVYRLWGKFR